MDLQHLFYLTATIFFTLLSVLLVGILIAAILLIRKLNEVQKNINNTVSTITKIASNPTNTVLGVGMLLARNGINKVMSVFQPKE